MNTPELLKKSLDELDIHYSESQIIAFMSYLAELRKWNRAYNLTAIKTDKDIVIKHFIDSLLYLKAISGSITKVADFGSGAGFPGLPIKLVRADLDMTLIEPSRKKASFLRHITRQLNISSLKVLEERIENLGDTYEGTFDVIVSRATSSVSKSLTLSYPFIKKGGMLVLSKGPKLADELKELEASSHADKIIRTIHQIELPFSNTARNIVALQRIM